MSSVAVTATWPATSPSALGLEHHRLGGGRQHVAVDPEQPARLVDAGHRVAGGLDQPGQDEVAEGVAGQLLLLEAVLEGRGQRRAPVGQGHQALAEVPRRDDVEQLAQAAATTRRRRPPTRRPSDLGVGADGPQGGGRPVAAADGHDPGGRSRPGRGSSLHVPVEHGVGMAVAAQPAGQLLGQHHRPVAAAGAAHGHRQVGLALPDVGREMSMVRRSSSLSRNSIVSGRSRT